MICKATKNKRHVYLMLFAGAISMAFGIIGVLDDPELTGDGAMLMGMFTGLGAAFAGVSIIRLLHLRFAPAKKLKEEEINKKDERNIQVTRASYAVSNTAATLLFAVMAFVFVWLGYRIPAFISVGAMWVQVLVFLISYRILNKKM